MRKLIFSINVTIDGFADHTAVIADYELHDFYSNLFDEVDTVLLGRKTYQLLQSFWPNAPEDPISTKSMIKFADGINSISKIVFSKTLEKVDWSNTRLVKKDMIEEVLRMKQQPGKSLSVGGLSIASTFMQLGMIDEYWFVVQPIVLGTGTPLFKDIKSRMNLKLLETRTFGSGVVVLHYQNELR
ncbi:MAG: dihydrofolate reductase family protein [Ignavibacteriales bacterium]|nr:dihydrofolate reductase family protein [Ignavibacteriales bacterium]